MNVSIGYCEDVLKTLPVGYYLGHRVTTRLDPAGDTTYIRMDDESVTVAYKNIVDMLAAAPDTIDRESVIRGLFYHEISHALLTYKIENLDYAYRNFESQVLKALCNNLSKKPDIKAQQKQYLHDHFAEIMNIFEDERIETVCKDYYMNVDFKRNLFLINNIDPKSLVTDNDPIKRFYGIVRYRVGDAARLNERDELICKWAQIVSLSFRSADTVRNYFQDVVILFINVMKDCEADEKKNSKARQSAQENCADNAPVQSAQKPLTEDQIQEMLDNFDSNAPRLAGRNDTIKTIAKKLSVNNCAAAIRTRLEKILNATLNKNKNRSSSSLAYAGRIDPRATASKDYRWFTKKTTSSANKRFDKVHFNLFCDDSGSFYRSKMSMNALICALKNIEATNPDFSVTVLHCSRGIHIPDQNDPYLSCNEGSCLPYEAKSIYDSVQKPMATNVNLVVFDGRMYDSYDEHDHPEFGAFNHHNCIVVSDNDNQKVFETFAPAARKTFITKNYADVFINEVLTQVERLVA